jgi:hypothetical protein
VVVVVVILSCLWGFCGVSAIVENVFLSPSRFVGVGIAVVCMVSKRGRGDEGLLFPLSFFFVIPCFGEICAMLGDDGSWTLFRSISQSLGEE